MELATIMRVNDCQQLCGIHHTDREFFFSGVLVLFATVVVRHGDDSKDEVDEIERTHEDDDDEE